MALSSGEHVWVLVNKEYYNINNINVIQLSKKKKKSMKPKKFKQGFQTKENDLKEQEFVELLRIYPEFPKLA